MSDSKEVATLPPPPLEGELLTEEEELEEKMQQNTIDTLGEIYKELRRQGIF